MTTARDLVNAIQSGKSATIQATFDALMTEKIQGGIEAYRQAVIDNTFNPELVVEGTESDDADDSSIDESEESIDELSGATLGSYAAKAHKDIRKKSDHAKELDADPKVAADTEKRRTLVMARDYNKDGTSKHRATIDKLTQSIEKQKKKIDPDYPKSVLTHTRYKGIDRAVKRLQTGTKLSEEFDLSEFTLEEIQDFMESEDFATLDELSKKTLSSYIKKASIGNLAQKDKENAHSRNMMHHISRGDLKSAAASGKTASDIGAGINKRVGGIIKAANKLASESEEFDLSEFTLEEIQEFMESEDFASLDELSKSTLANYYSKAIGDRHTKDLARDSAKRKGEEDSAKKLGNKVFNRSTGLEKAKTKFFAKD